MNQIAQITNAQIIAELKSIAPSQFEKKFKGLSLEQISTAIAKAVYGLTNEQIQAGFLAVWEKGFIPDPIMFRQWCLGNRDFSFDDEIADSYVGKYGALANIIKWLETNGKAPISQAEKGAYDDTYTLWQNINSDKDRSRAEMAFKDFYEKRVSELVKNRVMCQAYVAPVAIAQSTDKPKNEPASRDYAMSILQNIGKNLKQELGEVA